VFGNGRTRLNIDFDDVRPYGFIYACNAVYREYTPDFLIAVDRKMIDEINQSQYQLNHKVFTYPSLSKEKYKNFNYIDPNLGWSSGPSALYIATKDNPNEIYIFGFDFEGLEGRINNVFANTENYKRSVDPATFHGNWRKQTETIIKENPKLKYIRVSIPNFFKPNWGYDNYSEITYEEFGILRQGWKKIR
jgi:hypothetical protein